MVGWGLATPDEAIAMASRHPLAVLAPALAAHGIALAAGEVEWSDDLKVRRVRIDRIERRFGMAETLH
jgi:N-acetylglucosamine-6-phosphate deacetylase